MAISIYFIDIYIYNYTDGAGFWLQFFFLQKSIKMSLKVDILLKIELATEIGTTKYLGVVLGSLGKNLS